MAKLQRYDPDQGFDGDEGFMIEASWGEWVKVDDVVPLLKRLHARLRVHATVAGCWCAECNRALPLREGKETGHAHGCLAAPTEGDDDV